MKSLVLKIIISIACMIALAVFFFYGEQIIPETDAADAYTSTGENYRDAFKFDPEELTYDGTGDLDLLEGVSLEGYNFQELKNMVFTRIYTGNSLSEKVIEYTADTEDGRVRSKRALKLENYKGPKITLPDEIPSVIPGTIDGFSSLLIAKDGYEVDDGFGNDMRDHADVSYEKDERDSALIHYTIAFDNMFGDRAVEKVDVLLSGVSAHLVLTDSQITLHIGDDFMPSQYISVAEADGGSAIDRVLIRGNIDTSKVGTYIMVFDLDGQTASLTVNVIE